MERCEASVLLGIHIGTATDKTLSRSHAFSVRRSNEHSTTVWISGVDIKSVSQRLFDADDIPDLSKLKRRAPDRLVRRAMRGEAAAG